MSPADSPTPAPADVSSARWSLVLDAVFYVLTGRRLDLAQVGSTKPGTVPAAVATAARLTEVRVHPLEADDPEGDSWVVELACAPFAAPDRFRAVTEHMDLTLLAHLGCHADRGDAGTILGLATGAELTLVFAGHRPTETLCIGESFDAHVRLQFEFGSSEARERLEQTEVQAINQAMLAPLAAEFPGMPAPQAQALLADIETLAERLRQRSGE